MLFVVHRSQGYELGHNFQAYILENKVYKSKNQPIWGNVENPIISTHPYSNISLSFDSKVAIKIKCNVVYKKRAKAKHERIPMKKEEADGQGN